MDENEITEEEYEIIPLRHTKWSLLVLGASWLYGITQVTHDTARMLAVAAAQHNLHKREESKFYEVVRGG